MDFRRAAFFFALLFLLYPPGRAVAQTGGGEADRTGGVPEELRRPRRGESPRYPRDLVIGELGAGEAPEGAYVFGRDLIAALMMENRSAPALARISGRQWDEFLGKLRPIGPRSCRIGGGREESDGSISFLVRFLGREQGIAGELYLRREGEQWLLDDLVLEEPADLAREPYPYDFSPYERFY